MLTLVLLPGMDGTGDLFTEFVRALPKAFRCEVACYPRDRPLSYAELAEHARSAIPINEPFVLLAESFSTPLAIQIAATNPPNLKGLILCAGFATSPFLGWKRALCSFLAPALFRLPLPDLIVSRFLLDPDAPPHLRSALRAAVCSVAPNVLSGRLRALLTCDARAELAQIAVPILYLQAKRDRLVSGACLEEMRRIKPTVILEAIDGPHLLLQREPRQCAEIVIRFTGEITKEGVKLDSKQCEGCMQVAESTISAQEKQARTERNQSVLGTLAMEGISLDPVSLEIGRRFDQGEITLVEFSAAMQAHIAKLASATRQAQAADLANDQG